MSEETTNNYLYKKRVQLLAFNMAHLRTLGLKDSHISLIVAVESFRQNKNELPYPSNEKVAERMGVSTITIKRRTRELRELKLLQRPKGGIKPIWNFASLYELLENRKKESLNRLNGVTKYQSPNGDKKVSNSSKNKPLTRSTGDPVRSPQLDQNEVLTGSVGDTLKVKIKENNKPSSKVTLRDNLTIEPGINFEKKSDINFKSPLKSKRSKTTFKKKPLLERITEFYNNLPPENTIERLTEVLTGKVINQILVLKEGEIRSRCKVFYHRINRQALTTLTLDNFNYGDVPEGSKKRNYLISTISKRAWQVVSNCLEGKRTFPLVNNGISKNPVSKNGYISDPPQKEAKRILRSLQINNGSPGNPSSEKVNKRPVLPLVSNREISLELMSQFYRSLHDKGNIGQVVKILIYKAVQLFLTAKKPDGRKINLDVVTDRVLKGFPFQDVPLVEPKRGKHLIQNISEIVSSILINTGNKLELQAVNHDSPGLEITEPARGESSSYRHNGNGNGSGYRAGDKVQVDKPSNGNGHKRVSDAKLHKAFDELLWYRKFKERSLANIEHVLSK